MNPDVISSCCGVAGKARSVRGRLYHALLYLKFFSTLTRRHRLHEVYKYVSSQDAERMVNHTFTPSSCDEIVEMSDNGD
jgi:hypothetical protein